MAFTYVFNTKIVDDFGIEYVGERHTNHLRDVLKQHYKVTENWKGNLFTGINLNWEYSKRICHLTMEDYIATLDRKPS